jgi:DNA-directed RNA polymerase subunit K/omega
MSSTISDDEESPVDSTFSQDQVNIMKDYETMKKNYQTTPVLSKYEKTRVLSERASQISNGSPVFVPNPENFKNSYDIALFELKHKKIPFIIKRPYGNTYEYWKLEDLIF